MLIKSLSSNFNTLRKASRRHAVESKKPEQACIFGQRQLDTNNGLIPHASHLFCNCLCHPPLLYPSCCLLLVPKYPASHSKLRSLAADISPWNPLSLIFTRSCPLSIQMLLSDTH